LLALSSCFRELLNFLGALRLASYRDVGAFREALSVSIAVRVDRFFEGLIELERRDLSLLMV